MKKTVTVGIVGCGLIGKRRADNLGNYDEIVGTSDLDILKARKISNFGVVSEDYTDITRGTDADVIIVATPNKFLAKIAIDALRHNKHVLIEKPAGINANEISQIANESLSNNKKVFDSLNPCIKTFVLLGTIT